jgi:putative peptidoglycan binding protein/D-alanyl-D-alanine carboxypeptidase-like protein
MPAQGQTKNLTDEIDVPAGINAGLECPSASFLTSILGNPREQYSGTCEQVTNRALASLIVVTDVGPFNVQGLRAAVDSLRLVMADIQREQRDVYAKLGTAGMLCCRYQRNSTNISSHSWGTAIDLKLDGKLDVRGNNKVHYGLTLIAPIFNKHGWHWGAAFRTEDAMHFEVSKATLTQWERASLFGAAPTGAVLKKGDKGPEVRQLQEALLRAGVGITVDSDFGPRTEQAVKYFQQRRGLNVDGIVGSATRSALRI